MEAAGLITLAVALLYVPYCMYSDYKNHFSKLGPREAALAEASHGAAMIVLAVLAWFRLGRFLPAWFPLAALAVTIWGSLRLHNGAKFSVGWRDPKLIARALVKAGSGIAIYRLVWNGGAGWVPSAVRAGIGVFRYETAPYGDWAIEAVVVWCLVTGMTKLFLLLRGFPPLPMGDPGMPHGTAGFSNPDDPGFKL